VVEGAALEIPWSKIRFKFRSPLFYAVSRESAYFKKAQF
jgi:hypothetical protein